MRVELQCVNLKLKHFHITFCDSLESSITVTNFHRDFEGLGKIDRFIAVPLLPFPNAQVATI